MCYARGASTGLGSSATAAQAAGCGSHRPPLVHAGQVQVGEDEPEDIAVRRFMKCVVQSGVINNVSQCLQPRSTLSLATASRSTLHEALHV